MQLRVFLSSIFYTILATCIIFASSSNASDLAAYVKQQNVEQINIALYALFGSMILLLIVAASQLYLVRLHKNRNQQDRSQHQHILDNLSMGIVHVDLSGKILYINDAGAKYLGRAPSKLGNSHFVSSFAPDDAQHIETTLNDTKAHALVRAKASHLYLAIQSGEIQVNTDKHYRIVTLYNQNTLQRALLKSTEQNTYLSRLINACQFGQARINIKEDRYSHDWRFNKLLKLDEINDQNECSDDASVSEFVKRIHNHDIGEWTKALTEASKNDFADCRLRMRLSTSSEHSIYLPVDIHIVADKHELPISNDDTEAKHIAQFTILVRSSVDLEKQKSKFDILNQQLQAMFNAIPDAVYALDEQGNLLCSNSRFDQLLRRLASNTQSKNLLEINPFPDEVMQLHKNASFMPNESSAKEFEQLTHSGESISLKLDLGYYATSNRLNQQKTIGIVGVLQDLTEVKNTHKKLEQERERYLQTSLELIEEQENLVQVGEQFRQAQERIEDTEAQLNKETEDLAHTRSELAQVQQRMARFLDLAPVAIATINGDDRITSANRVMLERLKYTDKELRKGNIYKLFSDPAEAGTTAKQLNKTGRLRDFHVKLKGNDGNIYPSELTVDVLNPETQEYLFWLIDRSDEEFQRSKFETLLQHSDMPMAILEEKGFSKLNQAACNFFCVDDEEELFGLLPYSTELNKDDKNTEALALVIEEAKSSGKALTIDWTHFVAEQALQCQATYVPIYKDHIYDSILCMWSDRSASYRADAAIAEAMASAQAAEEQRRDTERLLVTSEQHLADNARQLADTSDAMQKVQEDLEHTKSELLHVQTDYQQSSEQLQHLKQSLDDTFEELTAVQHSNADLHIQIDTANHTIDMLKTEREDISNALSQSKAECDAVQMSLAESKNDLQNSTENQEKQVKTLNTLLEKIKNLELSIRLKDEVITDSSLELDALKLQLETSNNKAQKLQIQLDEQGAAQHIIEKQKEALAQHFQAAQQQLREATEHRRRLQSEVDQSKTSDHEVTAIHAQQSTLMLELAERKAELIEAQQAVSDAVAIAEQYKAQKHEYSLALEQLEAELTDIKTRDLDRQAKLSQNVEQQNLREQTLNDEHAALQARHADIQNKLMEQERNHADLNEHVFRLEQTLSDTQQQLGEKSDELRRVEQALEASSREIVEQEKALLHAQQQFNDMSTSIEATSTPFRHDIGKLPMPNDPKIWFDLLHYLQNQPQIESMQTGLSELIDEIEANITETESAIQNNELESVSKSAESLMMLAKKIKSDALLHLMQSISSDCKSGMIDNVSIRWPAAKNGLQGTLRVVYSHLH